MGDFLRASPLAAFLPTLTRRVRQAYSTMLRFGLWAALWKTAAWLLRRMPGLDRSERNPSLMPSEETYAAWIARSEPSPDELRQQTEAARDFAYAPLISLITPVHNPEPQVLLDTIASVQAQTYPEWELCLVDAGSDRAGISDLLAQAAAGDPRIRIERLEANPGISANTNRAVEMARGEFLAFLDHDDTLAPFALYEVARRLDADPALDLLYSDHDLLDPEHGARYQPLFKPGWSPDILLSANYLAHLTVIRTSRVREAGGFDPATDGAQDWDLFLRVTERTERIAHIPHILYHWRDSVQSTASDIWSKPYAPPAQLRAIAASLTRRGLPEPKAVFDPSGYIRVGWSPLRPAKVSIIIPSNGANRLLRRCINSILRDTRTPEFEIVVVNNGPKRPEAFPYYSQICRDPHIRVVHDERPFNYSAANNFGARLATGDLLLFINNDIEVLDPDWLAEMALWAGREEIGAVGAKLIQPNGTLQHAGVIVGLTGFAGHVFAGLPENQWTLFGRAEWYRDYQAVTAACLMLRREVFERLGGFDETFLLTGNDVELCLRLRAAGLRVVVNPFARLKHLEGATRGGAVPARDYFTSYSSYRPWLAAGDPFFNPNLSYWSLVPALAGAEEPHPLDFVENYLHNLEGENLNAAGS